jgi:hypothetical protein
MEDSIARLVSPDEYAHHIGQVVSVNAQSLQIVKRKLSISEPFALHALPMARITRVEYQAGLAPLRIVFGVLLLCLLAGIAYFLFVDADSRVGPISIKAGLMVLAAAYGLKWTFSSRRHQLGFHFHDGDSVAWRSRSGDFSLKQRAVDHVLAHFRANGLLS